MGDIESLDDADSSTKIFFPLASKKWVRAFLFFLSPPVPAAAKGAF